MEELLQEIEPILSLALFAANQASVTFQVADAYIGHITGPKVLRGEINRKSNQTLQAGIMFCDVRGFTAMSETLGGEEVVQVMNRVFDAIGDVVDACHGEILKFIGDALLIVFPVDAFEEPSELGSTMIQAASRSIDAVDAVGKDLGIPLAVGFGGHIGEVVYGNIGTKKRLDFTVMGPAVNLASRLESLCKPLDASLVVSEKVAHGCAGELSSLGSHQVKGVSKSVQVWGIPNS